MPSEKASGRDGREPGSGETSEKRSQISDKLEKKLKDKLKVVFNRAWAMP